MPQPKTDDRPLTNLGLYNWTGIQMLENADGIEVRTMIGNPKYSFVGNSARNLTFHIQETDKSLGKPPSNVYSVLHILSVENTQDQNLSDGNARESQKPEKTIKPANGIQISSSLD